MNHRVSTVQQVSDLLIQSLSCNMSFNMKINPWVSTHSSQINQVNSTFKVKFWKVCYFESSIVNYICVLLWATVLCKNVWIYLRMCIYLYVYTCVLVLWAYVFSCVIVDIKFPTSLSRGRFSFAVGKVIPSLCVCVWKREWKRALKNERERERKGEGSQTSFFKEWI